MRLPLSGIISGLLTLILTVAGWAQTPITTIAELDAIRSNTSGNYVLANDIDASPTAALDYNGGLGWQPISNFTGTLDGNGFTISGLTINQTNADFVGLFSSIGGSAQLLKVRLDGASIVGQTRVAGLVGRQNGGTVNGCRVYGAVSGIGQTGGVVGELLAGSVVNCRSYATVTGRTATGGVVGEMQGGSLSACLGEGDVTATQTTTGGAGAVVGIQTAGLITACVGTGDVSGTEAVGGLVGRQDGGTIESCLAEGAVGGTAIQFPAAAGGLVGYQAGIVETSRADGDVSFVGYVGGIAGHSLGTIDQCIALSDVTGGVNSRVGGLVGYSQATSITDSYAAGAVTGPGIAGGLVGETVSGNISNCYARGRVSGGSDRVGGLIGEHGVAASLSKCYSIGEVVATFAGGGLIGFSSGSVSSCYWNTETSGFTTSAGGVGAQGRTTEEMTLPFAAGMYAGWLFANTSGGWSDGGPQRINNGYPCHWWNAPYTLQYGAGTGGSLTGETTQQRVPGADCTPVTAVPSVGYTFSQWDDGLTTAMRTDRKVRRSFARNASFAINKYTLTYTAGPGGIIFGPTTQTIDHGSNGAQVIAQADTNTNHIFLRWSDGSTSNPRTDLNVTADISVTAEFVIPIYTVADFDRMRQPGFGVTRNFLLMNDIDATSTAVDGWTPIGNLLLPFNDHFDGGGHTISNLVVDRPGVSNVGLFGVTGGSATISNLHLRNANVVGSDTTGIIVGTSASPIQGCSVTGSLTGRDYVGGIVGLAGASVTECFANVDVTGRNVVGGLIGYSDIGTVARCYAVGDVTGDFNGGGLVGIHDALLADCFATGTVLVREEYGGGFAGSLSTSVTRSYSTGLVLGSFAFETFGGFVGGVSEPSQALACYWDKERSGMSDSLRGEGRTTADMTIPDIDADTYVGWNFDDVWTTGTLALENNGYPFHRWQTARVSIQYNAGAGGSIGGAASQTRIPGGQTSLVFAVPDPGFAFDKWSDGNAASARTDRRVTEDVSFTAQFVAVTPTPTATPTPTVTPSPTVSPSPTSVTYTVQQAVDALLGLTTTQADRNGDGIVDAADTTP